MGRAARYVTVVIAVAIGAGGCASTAPKGNPPGSAPASGAGYTVSITPADFPNSTRIDNRYFPLVPGTRLVYAGTGAEGAEQITTDVTRDTRVVGGITAVVVHDYATVGGKLTEDTYDWYAQDKVGNVWYLGEDTHKLDQKTGQLTDTTGSWEYGKGSDLPGIIMKGTPTPGVTYRQEYRKGEAEDQATILRIDDTATVPAGTYRNVVRTRDFSELDPSVVEEKLFAPGVGFVSVTHVKGPAEKIELARVEKF